MATGQETGVEDAAAEESAARDDGRRWLFAVVLPFAALFVLTILAMIATAFGDPGSPLSQFFDRHGMSVIVWEAAATIVVTLSVMTVDRMLTLRRTNDSTERSREGDAGR